MLPISSRAGVFTDPITAIFTATSATCVTGLVIYDTYTYWSAFGQIVLLMLIQVGGLGFMTFAVSVITLTKKKIGLRERFTMQESVGAPQMGGIVRMAHFILRGTLLIEGIGALLLAIRFCPRMGLADGLYYAVFHSISAFCNAGFDLFGRYEQFSSLTGDSGDFIVNFVIMGLIVLGGLGFFVWDDLMRNKLHFKRYRLHSKLVVVTTAILIFGGALLIFIFEFRGGVFEGKPLYERIFISLFQSVSPRTAGFNTVPLDQLTNATALLIVILMVIGGSSGSTAGGIKTTTFSVLFLSMFSEFKRRKSIECFMRRVDDSTTRKACCVTMMYMLLCLSGTMLVCFLDGVGMKESLFECSSALSTVGLSLGITPGLSGASHLILVFLMYCGRVGSLTLVLAFADSREHALSQMPLEKITIG